ncbi:BMP family ABC transporter substrate-binding protein [candidate division KSB3 bacterium]|uniref:BMP family ABC transporter substrate-binding protein n=1 Tax=candidate division KSB3 bacterium TaxID=2044937 RepID=A0A2G6KAG6_9BACT|nr:MAG: BMP family ABC transporter substrate-binding protein [candidate division KSB3 bacterium]
MKKLLLLVVVLTLSCWSVFSASASDDKIMVALVIPSTIDDMAWSQSMYEGIKAVQAELGEDKMEVAVSERLWNAVDAGAAIREYALQGYNIIIAHGAQYQSLLNEIAPEFPKTSFAYGTGFSTEHPNIFAYDPHAQEGAYLLGMLAGLKTQSNIIGIVGPVETGDAIKFNKGVVQGVKAVNPDADVRIAYTGSFGDLVAAAEIARTHIKAGADILTGSSQQSVGGINVTKEFEKLFWLSTDMDQSSLSPKTVLAAQSYNFKNVVKTIIDSRAEGVLGGKHLELGFSNDGLSLTYNEELSAEISDDIKAKIEEAKGQLIDGSLKISLE